jgi:hypothetical protein
VVRTRPAQGRGGQRSSGRFSAARVPSDPTAMTMSPLQRSNGNANCATNAPAALAVTRRVLVRASVTESRTRSPGMKRVPRMVTGVPLVSFNVAFRVPSCAPIAAPPRSARPAAKAMTTTYLMGPVCPRSSEPKLLMREYSEEYSRAFHQVIQ